MDDRKEALRDAIIHVTATKMAPLLSASYDSEEEAVKMFKGLVQAGRIKIGIMPFSSDGKEQYHSVTFIRNDSEGSRNEWVVFETGRIMELGADLSRVFTLTEEQYQKIYGEGIKS